MRYWETRKGRNRLAEARTCKGLIGLCIAPLLIAPLLLLVFDAGATVVQVTEHYDDVLGEGSAWFGNYWDLTLGDMIITYTLDMSEYAPPMWGTAWSSVGVGGGAWGWMSSGAPAAAETNPVSLDNDDKLNLGAPDRYDESSYDALGPETLTTAPIGNPWSNHGIWFDRDGVDEWQDDMWGMIDGATYNTGGLYDVVLTIHGIDATVGTMFATVNGVQTGFYDAWSPGEPDYYPVGKSISGDLTTLQVFASVSGLDVKVHDITVTGYKSITVDIKPGSEVNPVNLGSNGKLPVAVMGSAWFDVDAIDPTSVRLEGVAPDSGVAPVQYTIEDVDGDGYMDALYLFDMADVAAEGVEDEAMSLSFYVEGQVVILEDYVTFVGKTG